MIFVAPWWPLIERFRGTSFAETGGQRSIPPHWRFWRVVYTGYADWHVYRPSKVRHLWWRFWWVAP